MDFFEWFTEQAENPAFKRAALVSAATSGVCGLLLSGFWRGEPTVALLVLGVGSLVAGYLEGGGWLRQAATWLVAGLSFCAALALLGAVLERITVLHVLPALLVHALALYSLRVASRPLLVGAVLVLGSTAALLVPASRVRRPPVLTVTSRGALLLDEQPIDPDTVKSRFRVGDHVRFDLSDVRVGSPARDLANRVFVDLEAAGVHVEL